MKTLFFGTPDLAVPYLELLTQYSETKAVITTPDQPAGRGYEQHASPVKQAALKRNLPVLQPVDLKDSVFLSELRSYAPEVVIVVAYGKLLPPAVLKIPTHGFLNIHFSLLPAYRGAAPIQRALMKGEKETGVSLFWLDEGMDTGPIAWQKSLPIAKDDDGESLREKLVVLGMEGLKTVLDQAAQGKLTRQPQIGKATLAPSLKKEEGKMDWSKPAREIANLVRGTYPWPGAFTFLSVGERFHRLKVLKARPLAACPEASTSSEAGTIVALVTGKGFVVKCTPEFLQIDQVQPEGKRPMSAWEYWQGARLKIGDKLR